MDPPLQATHHRCQQHTGLRTWTLAGEPLTSHLIIVGVIEVLVIVIRSLALLHLVPDSPLAGGRMAVIHGIDPLSLNVLLCRLGIKIALLNLK